MSLFIVTLYEMQTRFYIEKRRDEAGKLLLKDRPVFMSVSFTGDRLMMSTGIKASYYEWDSELQRLKVSYPDSMIFNGWLETLSATAHKAWAEMQISNESPSREEFQRLFKILKPKFSRSFFDVFYLFLESGMNQWSTATFRKVRTIYKHLREFEDSASYKVSFGKMNDEFLERFQNFYAERGNSPNTTHKAINIVVWFMNWATDKGYNINLEYRKFYKSLGENKEVRSSPLFLNWEELSTIRDRACKNKRMERVRDLFSFMCFTGLRYTELQNLRKEDVNEKEIIIRRKQGKTRHVPMNAPALEIFSLYKNKYYLNNTAFPSISIITMNKYLKVIALEAGLGRKVESSDGDFYPLHSRLTAGMGVNTFLANAIRLNIPLEVISGFTGVQNDNRFRYIKKEMVKVELEKFNSLSHG